MDLIEIGRNKDYEIMIAWLHLKGYECKLIKALKTTTAEH
jgi:hypothetical protein